MREQRALQAKHEAGTSIITRSDLSLRELRDQWAEWATSPGGKLAPRTIESYLDTLDRHVLRLLGPTTKAGPSARPTFG